MGHGCGDKYVSMVQQLGPPAAVANWRGGTPVTTPGAKEASGIVNDHGLEQTLLLTSPITNVSGSTPNITSTKSNDQPNSYSSTSSTVTSLIQTLEPYVQYLDPLTVFFPPAVLAPPILILHLHLLHMISLAVRHGLNSCQFLPHLHSSFDDLNFHVNLMRQVGNNILFNCRPDGSRTTVQAQCAQQADALTNLLSSTGQPIAISRDEFLNSSLGTVLVPSYLNLDGEWSQCSDTITDIQLGLQDFTMLQVWCYILASSSHHRHRVRIVKIHFDGHDVPFTVIIGGLWLPVKPCRGHCWKLGHRAKH